ncbi:MAG TPA: bifunctional riboflavin kinase/FAD synthetase [Phycisphaerae bacterium]|nr:bifunctional riboflavin kinase/FAD synthetase [Phycisphaerae bacterium]HRY67945.1 bifunctional riboflavin kinase/FAD synthetase [Phycisphaerae bacterium]
MTTRRRLITFGRMEVIRTWESLRLSGVVLTIGNFDGVHRGHQAILAAGRRHAERAGTRLVVMTFDPHPAAILSPSVSPPMLSPFSERLRWLELAGADVVVVVESKPEFFAMSAGEFIQEVVLGRFAPVAMVEGASFGFGCKRQGDVHTLMAAGRRHGFEVEIVQPVRIALGGHPDAVISSSLVRQLLHSGTVDQAALCLGRPYALFGTVGHGAQRGRALGFPTVNLQTAGLLVPAEGVYAGRACQVDAVAARGGCGPGGSPLSSSVPAAISIGYCPTFDGQELLIEAHLLDFHGDLYGRALRIEFLDWLRGQESFKSKEALCEQIRLDVEMTRRILADHG